MVPSLGNVAASWKEEGSCIVLVPTGVREERFAVRGSHPSLLVVIDEGPHVIRKGWFEMAPSSRYKVYDELEGFRIGEFSTCYSGTRTSSTGPGLSDGVV